MAQIFLCARKKKKGNVSKTTNGLVSLKNTLQFLILTKEN